MKNEIQMSRKIIRNSNDIKWQKTKLNETSKMTSKINIWQMDKIAEGEKKQEKDQMKKM